MLEELSREVSKPRWTQLWMTCCFWPFAEEEFVVVGDLLGAMQSLCVCGSVRAAAAGPQSTHGHGFSVNGTVTLGW